MPSKISTPFTHTKMTPVTGFTLLELLVVLIILGFTSSFVTPNLWHSYAKSQQRSVLQQFALALDKYRLQAYHTGKPITLVRQKTNTEDTTLVQLPELPSGWRIETSSPLIVLPTGVTNGAQYKIKSPDRYWQLTITPLDGEHEIQLL